MRLFRRDPFDELVERQLELFAVDEQELLTEVRDAERAWDDAPRERAEEAYGDYQLVVDAIADRLLDLRETYAATVDAERAAAYRAAFGRAARRLFGRYTSLLDDLDDV